MTSIHPNFNQIAEHQYVGGPDRLIASRKDKDRHKDKHKDKDKYKDENKDKDTPKLLSINMWGGRTA